MELVLLAGGLLALVLVLVSYGVGRRHGRTESFAALQRARDDLADAKAQLTEKVEYIDGLWIPKECKQHVFPREPVLRKIAKGGMIYRKYLCQRCGEPHWTEKGA